MESPAAAGGDADARAYGGRYEVPGEIWQGRGGAWIDAPRFNVSEHVVLAPADRPLTTEDDFLSWCARRSLIPLERRRPLWRQTSSQGFQAAVRASCWCCTMSSRTGCGAVALVTSLLDPTPDEVAGDVAWRPRPAPTGSELIMDNLQKRWDSVRRFRPSRLQRSARTLRAVSHA